MRLLLVRTFSISAEAAMISGLCLSRKAIGIDRSFDRAYFAAEHPEHTRGFTMLVMRGRLVLEHCESLRADRHPGTLNPMKKKRFSNGNRVAVE